SYICNNTELMRFKLFSPARGYDSCMILPVRKSGNIIGTFNLYASEIDFLHSEKIELLEEAVRELSFALDVIEKDRLKVLADKNLKHSELRLKQAQTIAHIGSWELDFSTGTSIWSDE